MRELVDKFVKIERVLSEEKGEFWLFALFLREADGAGLGTSGYSGYSAKWDLIAAAPWIERNRKEALPHITKTIQKSLTAAELSRLSRVVLVDIANPEVKAINQGIRVHNGTAEIRDANFFGLQIKQAYIITSQRTNVNEPVPA